MIKKSKFIRKFMSALLMMAIIFLSVPSEMLLDTAAAATSGVLRQTNLNNYNFSSSKYMQIYVADYQNEETYIGSCTEAGLQMKKFEIGDMLVFCMEHGVVQKSVNLKSVPYERADFFNAYKNDGYEYAINNMFRVLMYAPVNESGTGELLNDLGFKDSKYYQQNGSSYTKSDWIAAIQMLVWESQQLMRDKNFKRQENGLYYQDSWRGNKTTPISRNHYTTNLSGKPAIDIYNFIATQVREDINIDNALASLKEDNPKVHTIAEDAAFPVTIPVKGGTYAGEYKIADKNGKKIDGISIAYDETTKEYSITIDNESLLDKTFYVKHSDGAAKRAEEYLASSRDYERVFWEYKTSSGHTQGFISGFDDPNEGFLKFTKGDAPAPAAGTTCIPPDVEVFPTLYIPIDKHDLNPGWDGMETTPMGDAGLDATYTLERQIGGGAWETLEVVTLDDYGSEYVFIDQPFLSASYLETYLTESGTVSGCVAHPIYGTDGEGNPIIIGYEHESESREPQRKDWDVTVNYRITESRPDGRYIDPDAYAGERAYTFTYHAETEDTCSYWCDTLPWTEVEYTFDWSATTGSGGAYSETSTTPSEELNYDKETFVNDVFRGDIQIIKSNEKYNPFKDSDLGGADSNISQKSYWTVKLESGGFEEDGYVHLVSADPAVLSGGTHQYVTSRTTGVKNDAANPMVVGTNGTLILKYLPYGTYTVTEVAADDPMYVLERFTVTVDEHLGNGGAAVNQEGLFAGYGQTGTNAIGSQAAGTGDYWNNRYDANIRDKVKSNVIKVEKYDAETGKIVYPGVDGAIKVFIRFKGNPDYTEAQNQSMFGASGTVAKGIYNRFLPNAESIDSKSTDYTFELDKNGEITIPYQLPYGIYEVCEWLLPEGYYVGQYNENGEGSSYDFGSTDTYSVYDASGNKVVFKDASEYTFDALTDMVVNSYTFHVTEQAMHVDGNFTNLVRYNGAVGESDGSYDKGDYPYTDCYRVASLINNPVKGKIEVTKEGEKLVGFKEEEKDGRKVMSPVFEMVTGIKDAVFGIFAAEDVNLKDGSEGPQIFDAETDEEIIIPLEKSTNLSNASKYDTGSFEHSSGAQLWYMLEREASEGNVKRTLYITPEQKDTTYSYVYQETDGDFNYRWDVEIAMNNQAGGRNVTKVNITKTTEAALGFTAEIPVTVMSGSVGSTVLSPIESFMASDDPLSWETLSRLESYDRTYIYEADGVKEAYDDGTQYTDGRYIFDDEAEVDLSQYCPDRYLVKYYDHYLLTDADMVTEERVVGTHQETKTIFEWNAGVSLISPAKDGMAIYQDAAGKYYTAVKGYSAAGQYTSLVTTEDYVFVETDEFGNMLADYVIPDGWSLVPFTGNPDTDPHYVIITQTDAGTGQTVYRILLNDMINWQVCTADGNFVKAAVQVYEVKYTQEAGDENGFTLSWDGFNLDSQVDQASGVATTVITKHANPVASETVDLGVGYDYEDSGDTISFWTIPVTAPVYFLGNDGIRTEMYYKGGMAHTTITIPADAVDHLFEDIVPTLNFLHYDADGNLTEKRLDWYSDLSPTNIKAEFNQRTGLPEGVTVIAKRIDSSSAGAHTYYTIDIVTNQTEDAPLEITFADEYKMRIYTAATAAGNGVGVIDLFNTYKTTVYTESKLIETITTDEKGKAHSSLLPLGSYIVRELTSDDNYVNEQEDKVVNLTYKDQFTPVVWNKAEFENKYFTVEIDMAKVFETAFKSGDYVPPAEGETVKFGLYAAEEINAQAEGTVSVTKKKVKQDTLIDVIAIDHTTGGIGVVSTKLPEGRYYLKEIEAPEKYIMSDLKYGFVVKEEPGDYSMAADFDFAADEGITGKFVLEEKGHVKTTIRVEERYPMPQITIDGNVYPLDTEYEDEYIVIDVDKDYTEIFIDTYKAAETNVVLPNGQVLKVKASDNTFEYTVGANTYTFLPTVTYTGYHAIYEEDWQKIKGEDLTDYSVNFTLTGAGTDKDAAIIDVTVNHNPSKTIGTEKGDLTPDGYQIFRHEAIFFIKDSSGNNVTPDADEIILQPKETVKLQMPSGAVFTVSMDKNGIVTASVENTLTSSFADAMNTEVVTTGSAPASKLNFAKNVTLGRQDTSADKLMIKINSDNQDAFAVENDHKPLVEFEKVDKDDHSKKLSGAIFEIYSAKSLSDWTSEPDQLIGRYTTGADGTFGTILDYGLYYYREVAAPSGYKLNPDFVRFRVIKGEEPYRILIINEKAPVMPGAPETPLIPVPENPQIIPENDPPEIVPEIIPDEPEKETEPLYPAYVPETGDESNNVLWIFTMIISLIIMIALIFGLKQKHE